MCFDLFARKWPSLATAAVLFIADGAKADLLDQRGPDVLSLEAAKSDLADFAPQPLSLANTVAPSNGANWFPSIALRHQDLTLTASGNTVFDLRNLVINGGTLTLEATAGTEITINVENRFSLLNSAKIVLSGGLEAADVTFNIIGRGSAAKIRWDSMLTGSINAFKRTVRVSEDSLVTGWVYAKRTRLLTGGRIIPPNVVSP